MQRTPTRGFNIDVTPLTKRVLSIIIGLYVIQLVSENWLGVGLTGTLAWWPMGFGFEIWQPLTCFLLNSATPINFLLSLLAIVFFLPPTERLLGQQGLRRFAILVAGISVLFGLLVTISGAVVMSGPYSGIWPFLTALVVIFGLSQPNAQILLFFVLPIKAAWVAWGTGLIAILSLLATRDMAAAMSVAGWIGGWTTMQMRLPGGMKRPILKMKQRQIKRELRKFEILEGGRSDAPKKGPRPNWAQRDDDDPIIH